MAVAFIDAFMSWLFRSSIGTPSSDAKKSADLCRPITSSAASNELAQADKAAGVWLIAVYLDWIGNRLFHGHIVEITATYEYHGPG